MARTISPAAGRGHAASRRPPVEIAPPRLCNVRVGGLDRRPTYDRDARRRPGRRQGPHARAGARLSDDDLERLLDPIMSPLVWDLGHIAAYEDLWLVHRPAARRCCARTSPRSTTRSRRRAPCAATSRSSTRAERAAPTSTTCASATLDGARARTAPTGRCTSWSSATSSSTPRRCARRMVLGGLLPDGEPPPRGRWAATTSWVDGRRRHVRASARRRRGLRLRQRAPAPRGRRRRPSRSPARR